MQNGSEQNSEKNEFQYESPDTANVPYQTIQNEEPTPSATENPPEVSWEASEYVHHHKSPSWYLGFTGITLVVVMVIYVLTRELLSALVIVLMGVAVAVYAGRKPNTIRYTLSHNKVTIGEKSYMLDEFTSYTIMQDGGINCLILMPTRRFMPPISIYFSQEDGEKIVSTLSSVLPHEERQPDLIDRLMRNIRF
jgi:hypothetical protein